MTIKEAYDWFARRKEMGLDDKCQEAENIAMTALGMCENVIKTYYHEREIVDARLKNGKYQQASMHDGAEWILKQIIEAYFPERLWGVIKNDNSRSD